MRLWPVAATGSGRVAEADIEAGPYLIPKGAALVFPILPIHRNGLEGGDEFRPERWLPTDPDAARLGDLFMPFSLGRRNCVGQNLAMLELKMAVASLAQHFRFELVSPVVQSENYLTFKPRDTLIRAHLQSPPPAKSSPG
mmetsp:Transcript_50232/g.104839  ORF Transcript_50232/g.104839 Transcript_50232/m.104839 type:complete len:140 (-) Transcript_50232:129-548(-)